MEVLNIDNVSKAYGKILALDKLNLTVEKGQVLGLLGPNGSGKTTTLGIILGILQATSGSYKWFENKYGVKHRLRIGSILETPNFYPYLDADENLEIVRQIKKVESKNFDEVLELVKLSGRRNSKFQTYSLGMKQRLAIAATLIGNPEVVIFDEPTNGLDPEGISEVRNTLAKIAAQGKTVIMASHILAEVERICSHVAIIKKGKLLAHGNVGSILSNDITIEIGASNQQALIDFLNNYPKIKGLDIKNSIIECMAEEDIDVAEMNMAAMRSGISLTHLYAKKRSLEQEFLEITSNSN